MVGEIDQVNVRVPKRARELMSRLARRLREEDHFYHRLHRFLTDDETSGAGEGMTQRLDRLEAEVMRLGTLLGADVGRRPPSAEGEAGSSIGTMWTTGEGRGRRLTPEGEAELQRLLDAGFTDAEIAKRLSVRAFSVASKRRRRGRDALSAEFDYQKHFEDDREE